MSEPASGTPFRPWLEERVVADDEDLLVVDKPSGLVVHGGDELLAGDVVSRLKTVLQARGADPYLGVHQRLDVGTSGVLAFVRKKSLNRGVAQDFATGTARKRYLACVEIKPGSPLEHEPKLELRHRLVERGDRVEVATRGGRVCHAECHLIARRGTRALVELFPSTGRTHQLRVQLAAVRAPVAGDAEHGGPAASRLLLHALSLELESLGRRFEAVEPKDFHRWLEAREDELGDTSEIKKRLRDAACLRYPLCGLTQALRWVNGPGDELPGVVVDRFSEHAVLSVTSPEATARRLEIAGLLLEAGARGVYLKIRVRADPRRVDVEESAPRQAVAGKDAPDPLQVTELGATFAVSLGDGLSTGLFLDQRDNRRKVRALASGRRVLNLFCYTGAFSVAAALGGAREVVSVDTSGRALERAKENFRLNGLDPSGHTFVREDVERYLGRLSRRNQRFDLIVLDPPSFSGGPRGVLSAARDYERIARLSLARLGERGSLLAVTNHQKTTVSVFRRMLRAAADAAGLTDVKIRSLRPGLDCPDAPGGPYPSQSLLVERAAPRAG